MCVCAFLPGSAFVPGFSGCGFLVPAFVRLRRIQVGTDGPIFGLDDILLPPEERRTNIKEPAADAADREHKYKTEHMQIYDQAGMEWPPTTQELPTMAHLGQRAFEAGALLLLFCTRRGV